MKIINANAIVRSKNAGPFRITLDIIFKDKKQFDTMKQSGIWSSDNITKLYKLAPDQICECLVYEPALAFKCTYRRKISSGAIGDTDIYGSQQHLPLYELDFPFEE